jgi:deoxyribonuclease V
LATRLAQRWDLSPKQAIALQARLARRVLREDRLGAVRHVGGVDIGFEEGGRVTRAAAVLLGFPDLRLRAFAIARRRTSFPYVPGLLSFREAPAALEALAKLPVKPDLLLCDGQGIAHPRRCGLASHLGLAANIPSIGAAKSRLIGRHAALPEERGAWVPLVDDGETIGAVLRTRAAVAPLYVSIGHRVSLASAIGWVLACAPRYRLPETTRWADRLAGASEAELARLAKSLERR